jgi:glucosamine-6-phosphate deaminase
MSPLKLNTFVVERLTVDVVENRKAIGEISAQHVGELIHETLQRKKETRIIFAAAPSQNEFLNELTNDEKIDWSRVVAFHMDEYIGLPSNSDKLFNAYLNEHIFSKVKCKSVYLINSQEKDSLKECARYEKLFREKQIDIVCMGIGENGHIAFNDPPVANFNDEKYVKVVELEERDKVQQVNDAGFKSVEDVPKTAYTLTIPALISAKYLSVVVPGIRKAKAVKETLTTKLSTKCPATILRTHPSARLFIDNDSASQLDLTKWIQ